MTKEKLIETIQKILVADPDLSFLFKLTGFKIETRVATIRERVDRR